MRALLVAAVATMSPVAAAADFSDLRNLPQAGFRDLAEDLGAAFSYKGITPATPLGVLGFDLGIGVTETRLENSSAFRLAGAGSRSSLLLPRLHVHKGLFGRLDVGAFVAGATQVDAMLFGAELRYAVLDDGLATPAVGVRLAGTRATGTDDLSFATGSLDIMVSKKLAAVTPYAGAGIVRVHASADGAGLQDERFNRSRFFAGVNVNLLAANIAFEAEKMGDNTSLSAKIGFRF